mgnify:CR=1 FL=1
MLALLAFLALNPSTTSIIALWTVGVTFYLPLPVYFIALGGFAWGTFSALKDSSRRVEGYGLVLLFLSGFLLFDTQQQLLACVALLWLTETQPLSPLLSPPAS